jgi:predicted lactoylglutathione lyase
VAESAVPILPSKNLRETLAFYERLGFENPARLRNSGTT